MSSSSLSSSSGVLPNNRRFIFPPTIILKDGEQKDTYQGLGQVPNLNMIIFFILIMLYDFAHDHIKSTLRIKPVDDNFLNICSQTVEQFKKDKTNKKKSVIESRSNSSSNNQRGYIDNIYDVLSDYDNESVETRSNSSINTNLESNTDEEMGGGSSQKGGKLEYVEDCFSDMKNMLYFILWSTISYMDIKTILHGTDIKDNSEIKYKLYTLHKNTNLQEENVENIREQIKNIDVEIKKLGVNITQAENIQQQINHLQEQKTNLGVKLKAQNEKALLETLVKDDEKLELHYFCYVVNLIFTGYTDMEDDTNENLTQFILEDDTNGDLFVKEINEGMKVEEKIVSTPESKSSFIPSEESSEKTINFISDNCALNNIKLIKLSILQAVCELYNKNGQNITLFNILLHPDFFYIFIRFLLKQRGFQETGNLIGNLILTNFSNKYYEKQPDSGKGDDIDVAMVTPSGTPQHHTTENDDSLDNDESFFNFKGTNLFGSGKNDHEQNWISLFVSIWIWVWFIATPFAWRS
jgi:hypothetical protein